MAGSPGPRPLDRHAIGAEAGAPPRLADLLAGLSLVADLGFGLPPEQSMRSCLVATSLARRLGLAEAEVAEVFYTALLEHIGCSGFAHEAALRYGDEMVVNAAAVRTNTADPRDVFATLMPAITRGRGPLGWARVVLSEIVDGAGAGRGFATSACEVGRATARRLGLPEGVQRGIHEVYEQWNGKGAAQGLRGEAISLPARLTQVAATAALFEHIGGLDHAVGAVQRRKGGLLDPSIVDAFVAVAADVLAEAAVDDAPGAILAAEPEPAVWVAAADLAGVAAAFGDIADLKSPYLHGHSAGVARSAREAALALGLDASAVEGLHVAALLHDLGRVGVSDAVWERPGPLSGGHWEQVRLHAYHSERILARSDALRPLAELAGMHHERLDGSGYHRGSRARDIPPAARILAAADAFRGMTEVRPYRPAHGLDEAATLVRDEVRAGRLDEAAVEAVLAGAGHKATTRRTQQPAGLSEREIEVLRALADGLTNRAIAERCAISPRTAEHHVQHIYDKIGASSRAAAALFAMQHDLLD
ncbi:MAG: HD domain-containing phosphohydrolase [Candidatus Limnocylindrales bacterium]